MAEQLRQIFQLLAESVGVSTLDLALVVVFSLGAVVAILLLRALSSSPQEEGGTAVGEGQPEKSEAEPDGLPEQGLRWITPTTLKFLVFLGGLIGQFGESVEKLFDFLITSVNELFSIIAQGAVKSSGFAATLGVGAGNLLGDLNTLLLEKTRWRVKSYSVIYLLLSVVVALLLVSLLSIFVDFSRVGTAILAGLYLSVLAILAFGGIYFLLGVAKLSGFATFWLFSKLCSKLRGEQRRLEAEEGRLWRRREEILQARRLVESVKQADPPAGVFAYLEADLLPGGSDIYALTDNVHRGYMSRDETLTLIYEDRVFGFGPRSERLKVQRGLVETKDGGSLEIPYDETEIFDGLLRAEEGTLFRFRTSEFTLVHSAVALVEVYGDHLYLAPVTSAPKVELEIDGEVEEHALEQVNFWLAEDEETGEFILVDKVLKRFGAHQEIVNLFLTWGREITDPQVASRERHLAQSFEPEEVKPRPQPEVMPAMAS